MPGPDPKPDRRRRNVPKKVASVVELPASGRSLGPIPKPRIPLESDGAKTMWREWWRSPQATQWHTATAVMPLSRLAALCDRQVSGGSVSAAELTEMRQLEERFGLSPRGLKLLNWVIVDDDEPGRPAVDPDNVSRLEEYRELVAAGG